jgi:hypothetical protein
VDAVDAALYDVETAPIEEPLRATLRMLRKLAREHRVDANDMRALLAAGVSLQQIEDALAVSFIFNTVDRLSRTFDFVVAGPQSLRCWREVSPQARLLLSAPTPVGAHRKGKCSSVASRTRRFDIYPLRI